MARNSRSERRSSGRPGSPRVRLFLALEPREEDRAALAEWRDRLVQGRDDLRPSAAETLHLTLVFLGYQAEKDVPAIAQGALGARTEVDLGGATAVLSGASAGIERFVTMGATPGEPGSAPIPGTEPDVL